MTTIQNPMKVLVAVLMCAAMIPGVHQGAYAMRAVNLGGGARSARVAAKNIFSAVKPTWHQEIANFLNSPTLDPDLLARTIRLDAAALGHAIRKVEVAKAVEAFAAKLEENPTDAENLEAAKRLLVFKEIVTPYLTAEKLSALGIQDAVQAIRKSLPKDVQRELDQVLKRIEIKAAIQRTAKALGEFKEDLIPEEGAAVSAQGSGPPASARRNNLPKEWQLQPSTSKKDTSQSGSALSPKDSKSLSGNPAKLELKKQAEHMMHELKSRFHLRLAPGIPFNDAPYLVITNRQNGKQRLLHSGTALTPSISMGRYTFAFSAERISDSRPWTTSINVFAKNQLHADTFTDAGVPIWKIYKAGGRPGDLTGEYWIQEQEAHLRLVPLPTRDLLEFTEIFHAMFLFMGFLGSITLGGVLGMILGALGFGLIPFILSLIGVPVISSLTYYTYTSSKATNDRKRLEESKALWGKWVD